MGADQSIAHDRLALVLEPEVVECELECLSRFADEVRDEARDVEGRLSAVRECVDLDQEAKATWLSVALARSCLVHTAAPMKAVICDRYGPAEILRIEEVEQPLPKHDEVLVKIHASTVNRSDAHSRSGTPYVSRLFHGLRRPNRRIPGSEFAGEATKYVETQQKTGNVVLTVT
jgi:hypothetical protein